MTPRPLTFGLLLSGARPPSETAGLAELVERLGFDVLWVADEKFFYDPYVSLSVAARHSRRLLLGTGVTDPYARHPALTAMALASLDELAGGRAVLGIGAGGSGFPPMGIARVKPAAAVREGVEVVRRLWRGETVTLEGEVITFRGGRLNFRPRRPNIPVYVAARGRHMLRLAGEIADGAIIAPYASPPGLQYALARIGEGARRAGRDLAAVDTVARVDVCIAPDRATAIDLVRRWIALPLWSSFPNWDYLEPLPGLRVPERVRDILASRDYSRIEEAAAFMPDDFAAHLAVAGTLDDVVRQMQAIAACGVTQITIHPVPLPGQSEEDFLVLFASQVMGALRAPAVS